jgi:hypothetical protein
VRVFIGLREISGYYSKLNEGLRALGVDSTFVSTTEHLFQYGGGEKWPLIKALQFCSKRYAKARITKSLWGGALLFLQAILLVWAIPRYDVFVFGYATSFLLLYDLPLLKLFSKRIIFIFHGSDARPPFVNGAYMQGGEGQGVEACAQAAKKVKRRIEKIERYADVVLSHPPYGQFHQKPYVLNAIVGFPADGSAISSSQSTPANEKTVRILHSPSRMDLKGTPQIRQAIENLRAKGHAIEWVELTGQPNAVVLQELARCDFIVDQLYSDWLMAGFSTEAAAAGKPSVVAGYELAATQKLLPPEATPPVLACHPDAIEAGIEKLITDRTYRMELGHDAQAFVEAYWALPQVAGRFLKIIQGDIPADWFYDPEKAEAVFLYGGGISETRLTAFLKAYLAQGGRAALQLGDKPALEQAFVEFAGSSPPH